MGTSLTEMPCFYFSTCPFASGAEQQLCEDAICRIIPDLGIRMLLENDVTRNYQPFKDICCFTVDSIN